MTSPHSIVWLRNDLRLQDNPALHHALGRPGDLTIVYIHDEESPEVRPLGAATKWWLHHSLASLSEDIRSLGGELVLRTGPAETVIPALLEETSADAVFWNRRYGATREIDARLKQSLRERGLTVESFAANLLFEPWTITNQEGNPFKVFTPFWKACLASEPPRSPLPAPTSLPPGISLPSDSLAQWNLLPTDPDWSGGLAQAWTPGEAGALARLEGFLENTLASYHRRDEPAPVTTSMLSPHLRFGEISPHTIWHQVEADIPHDARKNAAKFLSEIGWREFSYSILYTHTDLHQKNFRPEFDRFPWGAPEPQVLRAWQRGKTGVPLVDAGMRQLWHTGYMHNRVRMVAASFLIKNLLVDWRVGEEWFWDTLVDADEANNPASWQWVAGSGADAAPYFRVFNPALQAEKFDPESEYIRRWVPEYGTPDYPSEPIVDLKVSRDRALAAFAELKGERPTG